MRKKEVRRPTAAGWALLAACFLAILLLLRALAPAAYRFLACTRPVGAERRIVEGWMADYAVDAMLETYRAGDGQAVHWYCTGGPIDRGSYLFAFTDYATFTASNLVAHGLSPDRVTAVPAPPVRKDRTYTSALALKEHLAKEGITGGRIDIFTVGPHARRTRILFRKAMGPDFEIGVYSLPSEEYSATDWWTCSNGYKNVLEEYLGLVYVTFFFRP